MPQPLLAVVDLHVEFSTRDGIARAVNGVSFELHAGETLAILGESGSGKSVTAQAILRVLDPAAHITGGSVRLEGKALLDLSEREYRRIRGDQISLIFQDALSALNPVIGVGEQVAEMFRVHRGMSRRAAKGAAVEVMTQVKIPAALARYRDYPHQFSGGMRQRIMIAMMVALHPKVLIADEPTTALDVTVQSQIMELLARIQQENQSGLILITHDLGVVAQMADRVVVMYAGQVMEQGDVLSVYRAPVNPYTAGLLKSAPKLGERVERLAAIDGLPPSLIRPPRGCAFHTRCPLAQDKCRRDPAPALIELPNDRSSRCWFAHEMVADV